MTTTAYIIDALRTPRSKGKSSGALHEVKPIDLGATLLRELQSRHHLDTSLVDDVLMGCVTAVDEQGTDVAKMIVQNAGWDDCVPGVQLDRFCGSGLEAVNMGAQKIMSGWEQLIVAGGVESMSRVPMGSNGGALSQDVDLALKSGYITQGVAADLISTLDGWTREDLDTYAFASQQRATKARDQGYFKRSVVAVRDQHGMPILEQDDFIKPSTTEEDLASLRPAFEKLGQVGFDEIALAKYNHLPVINHFHTAGSSSGIVDGASAVLIGSESMATQLGMSPRARIVSASVVSTDPVSMLTGPAPAARRCLEKAGLGVGDIDLWEVNEAFSAVALRFMRELGIGHEITNVNGGAIALGHPLGATGGMLIGTLLDELERRDKKRGVVAMCVAGGMGIATLIERV